MPNETIGKTIAVAVGVCVVCSVFVSTAAVCLKPFIDRNKTLDKNRNILIAAGIWKKGADVDELFRQIETRVIDLSTGTEIGSRFWDSSTKQWVTRGTSPDAVDERKEEKTPETRLEIHNDLAKIKFRAKQALVYVRKDGDRIERLVLPMHGKGLWSTMYGFLALDGDLTTVGSFAFYQHGETPGLGGEVDNPKWKDSWHDKKAFGDAWEPEITVVKGTAGKGAGHEHEVDGLSGATLTARGVENLVRFWLGKEGYGPYLKNLASGGDNG